jgi:sugar-specific transcriptional regulator TrmB
MTTKIDKGPLLGLGLKGREVDIYLSLLKLGPCRAGVLIKAMNAPNSVIHLTLGRLVARGFVSYILRGQTKHYMAVEPARLVERADQQRKKLNDLVPTLRALRETSGPPQAEVYEGVTGLKNMCFSLIEAAKPGDEYLFLGLSSQNSVFVEEVYSFYREFTEVRLERGLVLRGIAHESSREVFRRYKWPHKNIRFVTFPLLQNISVCGNKAIIVPWNETRTSFMITSQAFTDNLREYFNDIWAGGSPGKRS